jgi:hypothetical protein
MGVCTGRSPVLLINMDKRQQCENLTGMYKKNVTCFIFSNVSKSVPKFNN